MSKSGSSVQNRNVPAPSATCVVNLWSSDFGAPEDWFPEKPDEINATRELYEILKNIVQRGHRVEVLDCWNGEEDQDAEHLDVSLAEVPVDHFRLFEGYLNLKP